MSSFISVVIFLGIFALVFRMAAKLTSKSPVTRNSDKFTLRQEVDRHGHRCYIDGSFTPAELGLIHLLARSLSPKEYFLFNNLIVPSDVIGTTQIDHVVVSKYGLFVIENKDYNGWIFANKNHKNWTQTLPGGHKNSFQNPLLQNYAHTSALREQMQFIKNRFFSVVVFSELSTFKTPRPDNVLFRSELIDFILSKQKPIFKEVELLVVIGKLSMLCQTVEVTSRQHTEATRIRIASKQVA